MRDWKFDIRDLKFEMRVGCRFQGTGYRKVWEFMVFSLLLTENLKFDWFL